MSAEIFTVEMIGKFLEGASSAAAEAAVAEALAGQRRVDPNAKPIPTRKRPEFVATAQVTANSLHAHMAEIRDWCSHVNISDSPEHKRVSQIYVDLDTYLLPLQKHESPSERLRTKPLIPALCNQPNHMVLLGGPGAGKTTSLKKISLDYFQSGRALLNFNFPVLLRLRELARSESSHPVLEALQAVFAIGVKFPKDAPKLQDLVRDRVVAASVATYVDSLNCLILLDGFDEIAEPSTKNKAMEDIVLISKLLRRSRFVLTCRSQEFRYYGETIKFFELASLTIDQIKHFATKWLGEGLAVSDFVSKIQLSPFADTAMRPLTIAYLCAIYERSGDIPDRPKSVYRRVVYMLLKDWDEERNIKRVSRYAEFDVDRKIDFLGHLAFELTTFDKSLRFSSTTLREIYRSIHLDHGLPANDAENVVREIESHNGLFVQSGFDHYEFAHKSLQEFLAADYIVRLPSLVSILDHLPLLANELAIATSLSSKPGDYLVELMLRIIDQDHRSPPQDWYSVFATRLVQEKPDFRQGKSAFCTIAYLALLHNQSDPRALTPLLKPAIPVQPLKSISQYYAVRQRSGGNTTLVRISRHSHLRLPGTLTVPDVALVDE